MSHSIGAWRMVVNTLTLKIDHEKVGIVWSMEQECRLISHGVRVG